MEFFSLHTLKLFGIGFICMVLIDIVWLKFIIGPLFSQYMGHLMRENALILPALLTRAVMVIGLLLFVHGNPAYSSYAVTSFLYGALLGGCIYAVYDLTNYATLKGRSPYVMLLDIAWGCLLGGVISLILYYVK